MRITCSQILMMIVLSGFAFAGSGNAQEVLNKNLNLDLKDVTLKEALHIIEEEADVKFVYSKESVQNKQLINLEIVNEKLSDVLEKVLEPLSLEYEIISERIVLKKKTKAYLPSVIKQSLTVTGKVSSEAEGALPGVSVVLKGTTTGTVTDVDGMYTLTIPDPNSILVYSFIGYLTEEIPVNGRTVIDLVLMPNVEALQEIVVVGYGNQQKKDVTGVVTAIDSKNFNQGAIVSPDNLITGKIAGVQIQPSSGEPGAGVNIRIRGGTSIRAENEPLYVIDGFPVHSMGTDAGRNPLNFINPNDIETFTVLKDASAAAIYGSRGANGVILITTKKGKKGTPTVTYEGFYSVGEVAKKYDVFNADQFREVIATTANQNLDQLSSDPAIDTDWQDQIFRSAIGSSHTLTMSGGLENLTYRASIGHQEQEGIIKTSYTKKTNFALNLDQNLFNEALNIKLNVKGAQTEDRFSPAAIGAALGMDPTKPVYDDDSPYGGYFEWRTSEGLPNIQSPNNPVADLNLTNDVGQNFRGLGNIQFDYKFKPVPGLRANLNLGYDVSRGERQEFLPTFLKRAVANNGRIQYRNPKRTSGLLEAYLNYTKDIPSINSRIDVTGGYSWQNFFFTNPSYITTQLSSNIYDVYNPAVGELTVPENPNTVENRLISFFGRINYSLKDKYLLTVNLRRDGSTRFGPENKWGLFPSAAFGWRIIDESFMAGLKNVVSDLKLRVGYGITGNQGIPDFKYISIYQSSDQYTQYQLGDTFINTVRPSGYDVNLQWEETASLNIGLDYGFLQGRLSGALEFYQKNTTNLLFDRAVPPGANRSDIITTNVGEVRNRGVEFSITAIPVDRENLTWNLSFNASSNKNEIIVLDGSDDPAFQGYPTGDISGGTGNRIQIHKVGQPVNAFYVYKHKTGENGKPITDNFGTVPEYNEVMYHDINGDGLVNADDRRPYKNPAANVLMGLTSLINYKNIDFSFTLRGSIGNYVYNNVASNQANYQRGADSFVPNNMLTSVLETNFYRPQYFSDYYVEDASFLRMDNMSLGYALRPFSEKLKLRVYGTVQNAFLVTNYSGLDPEATISGIDNNIYPRSRTFIVGLSIGL
ncbi:MAG TPA: TonB-dependent receptor [Cytophagales bacterium]|nr:TonB-dependent receptor [Cytophagales bacterium]